MKKEIWIVVLIFVLLFAINYSFLNRVLINFLDDSETGVVGRVIDGDTIVINGTSIRLLGINAPERGEKYFFEAKNFLETMVLNKTVRLEFGREKTDKYRRILAYIYINGENVNKKLIEEGFANHYFPSGKDKYYLDFVNAWKGCLRKNKNLCEKSVHVCSNCVSLEKKENYFVLKSSCRNPCDLTDWTISGEGRKKEVFPQIVLELGEELKIQDTGFSGDIFLRDDENKIVIFKKIN